MSRFVRTLSKIIFDPSELMVDSVKDIDKNKIAILLTETQEIAFHISLYTHSTTFLSCNFISNVWKY